MVRWFVCCLAVYHAFRELVIRLGETGYVLLIRVGPVAGINKKEFSQEPFVFVFFVMNTLQKQNNVKIVLQRLSFNLVGQSLTVIV